MVPRTVYGFIEPSAQMVVRWFKPIDSFSVRNALEKVCWKNRAFGVNRRECFPVADLHCLSSTDLGQVYVKTKHIGR